MAEMRAEEGMETENVYGAKNGSLSLTSPLVDANAEDESNEGVQKYANGDYAVSERKNEGILPSLRQNDEAGNAVESENGFVPPLDHLSQLLPPLDGQEESAPNEYASERGGLIKGLQQSRQVGDPVEIEQEPGEKPSADALDVEPSVEAQSIALDPLESEPEQQYLAQPEPGNTEGSECGTGDDSGRGEYNIIKSQEQLVNDDPGISSVVGEVSPEKNEEELKDYCAGEELDEQVVPDEALLMKEPSLSTATMEALIDAANEEPCHEQEGFVTVEDPGQHLEVKEIREEYATGSHRPDAFEEISNQVEVDNNEQERRENNNICEYNFSTGAAESVEDVIISGAQELGMDTLADEQDGKEALSNETPFVCVSPVNEAPSTESCLERELDIGKSLAVEEESLDQSLGTAHFSSDLEIAVDITEKRDEAPPLKAEKDITSTGNDEGEVPAISKVAGEDATTDSPKKTISENKPWLQDLNGKQGLNNPDLELEPVKTHNKQLEIDERLDGISQLESSANDISNDVLETSVTAEAPNKNHLFEHALENGDSLGRRPSRENGGEVEGSDVGYSTAEAGKVIDGVIEGEATITESAEKGNSENEDESGEASDVRTQSAETNCRDIIEASKEEAIVGGASESLTLEEKVSFKHIGGGSEKESEANLYTNGTVNICIADKQDTEAFHNERSREASLLLIVPQQEERSGMGHTNATVTPVRQTNWWGCCGLLDLLLHKEE